MSPSTTLARHERLKLLFRALGFIPHYDVKLSRWWFRRYVSHAPISPMRVDNRWATLSAYDAGAEGFLEVEATVTNRLGVSVLHPRRAVAEAQAAAVLRRCAEDAIRALREPAFAGSSN